MLEQIDLFYASNCDLEEKKPNPQKSELTPRAWATYNLIKHNSLVECRKTTQREIYEKVSGYEWNSDDKCHDHCPAIWKDITDNNLSYEHDKVIISNRFEYWIGSAEETKKFLQDLWKALSPRLKRYWQFVKKIGMDGQGKLFDKNGNQNQVRDFYECFNAYDITMQKEIEREEEYARDLEKNKR